MSFEFESLSGPGHQWRVVCLFDGFGFLLTRFQISFVTNEPSVGGQSLLSSINGIVLDCLSLFLPLTGHV